MDHFKVRQPSVQPMQTGTGQQPSAPVVVTNGHGEPAKDPANPATPGTESKKNPENPLDVFKDAFKIDDSKAKVAPKFSLDPAKLTEISGSLNFSQNLSPETRALVEAGDPKGFMAALDEVGRAAYKTSLEHTSHLTGNFVEAHSAHSLSGINDQVKTNLTQSELSGTPNYDHPVVKENLNRVAEALQRQHPDASPADIAKQAQKYIQELANAIKTPSASDTAANKANEPQDWTKYITG